MIKTVFNFIKKQINSLRAFVLVSYICIMIFVLYLPSVVQQIQRQDELNICTFADLISEELLELFTKETGIKVNCKYCELDSEMWTQLSMTGGRGLDLVTPIGLIASRLAKANLLQPIDHKSLVNFGGFHKVFQNKNFDYELNYHIPFAWTYYGIGYKKSFFEPYGIVPDSLQAIFEPDKYFAAHPELLKSYKVALFEDNPLELLLLGALHKTGDVNSLKDPFQMQNIINSYINHKHRWLYAYISANMRYYLNSVVPVVLSFAALLKDLIDEDRQDYGSCFPKEGTALVAQTFCIPSGAQNIEAAHKFMDFFMSEKMLLEVFNSTGYLPTKIDLLQTLKEEHPDFSNFIPTEEQMEKLASSNSLLTEKQIEQAWLAVKCAS